MLESCDEMRVFASYQAVSAVQSENCNSANQEKKPENHCRDNGLGIRQIKKNNQHLRHRNLGLNLRASANISVSHVEHQVKPTETPDEHIEADKSLPFQLLSEVQQEIWMLKHSGT